jgi:hypothetical protein
LPTGSTGGRIPLGVTLRASGGGSEIVAGLPDAALRVIDAVVG